MTDPDLDPTIAAASLRSPQEISRLTAGLPNLADQIMGTAAEDSQRSSVVAPSRHRWAWPAAFSAAAGVAVIALVVATTVGNRPDERSIPAVPATSGSPVTGAGSVEDSMTPAGATVSATDAPSSGVGTDEPLAPPPPVVFDSKPEFDDQGLTQDERDRRRAVLTPHFERLVELEDFVDGNYDLAARTLTVLWHSRIPNAATAIAADAAEAGVHVVLEAVPYTDREAIKAVPLLQAALQAESIQGMVEVAPDYRSVLVSTVKLAETPALQAKVERIALPILGAIPLGMFSMSDEPTLAMAVLPPDHDGRTTDVYLGLMSGQGYIDSRVDVNSKLIVAWWNYRLGEPGAEYLQLAEEAGISVRLVSVDERRTFSSETLSYFCIFPITDRVDNSADLPEVTSCRPNDDLTGVVVIGPGLGSNLDLQSAVRALAEESSIGVVPMTFHDLDPADPPALQSVELEAQQRESALAVHAPADSFLNRIAMMKGFLSGDYDLEVEPQVPSLVILWDGPRPQELDDAIAEAEAAGVTITVVDAIYTEDRIVELGKELTEVLKAEGISVNMFGPIGRYAGIRLGGPNLSYSVEIQDRARELADPYLDGMPLEFEDKTHVVQDMIDGIQPTFG